MAQSAKQLAAAAKRQEQKELVQEAAAKQAAKDAAIKPKPPSRDGIKPGQQMPLHLLNVAQREQDRAMRDETLAASTAAAKAVSQVLKGGRSGAQVHGPQTAAAAQVSQSAPPKPTMGMPSKKK